MAKLSPPPPPVPHFTWPKLPTPLLEKATVPVGWCEPIAETVAWQLVLPPRLTGEGLHATDTLGTIPWAVVVKVVVEVNVAVTVVVTVVVVGEVAVVVCVEVTVEVVEDVVVEVTVVVVGEMDVEVTVTVVGEVIVEV